MFRKILIANRGEIACRVMTTAARLGLRTVAVYSQADATAKHVAMADEAVLIGGAAVADSYLRGDRIIDAALATGAEAIHPGYGFLSENPAFVDAVEAAGLVFIGPSASAIRAMGLKDAAKALMVKAGVPVVPGYHGAGQDPALLAAEAEAIGYPVLIKARAGGGGKGMRLVEKPSDFKAMLEGAQREGQASFGDPAVLVEKYILKPRHIEMQIFGDRHGNLVHMFERDCSLQRRHQKVIEEAPAPDMPAEMRAAMGKAAIEAARAVGYHGAGTVEFMVDGSNGLRPDGFWFMEMNTRLQVEHPVSEAITGLDFVELQLRIAAGEALPVSQDDLTITGHAFEARVYAEDAGKGFLPATGRLDHLAFPQATAFAPGSVRIDSAVREGDSISPWYDPMIAKVIVHGPTRPIALAMLAEALGRCHVTGSVTNLAFLGALARHPGFGAGDVDTGLIARDLPDLTGSPPPGPDIIAVAALAGLGLLAPQDPADPWSALAGFRHWETARQYLSLMLGDQRFDLGVSILGDGRYRIEGRAQSFELVAKRLEGTGVAVETDQKRSRLDLVQDGPRVTVFGAPQAYGFVVIDPLQEAAEAEAGGDTVLAPMPGLVKLVTAIQGQNVIKGEPLVVLEAMKMEHTLTAPRDGVVAEVMARPGDQVSDGTLLLALEPDND
jgi:3-methylcrotonyl-CoA carboxylase alpha subunit